MSTLSPLNNLITAVHVIAVGGTWVLICPDVGLETHQSCHSYSPKYNHLLLIFFPDLLTVSETANEPPQEEGNSFNSPRNLAMEATYINHNFSQQCLRMVRWNSDEYWGLCFRES